MKKTEVVAVLASDFLFPDINEFLLELIEDNDVNTSISVDTIIMERKEDSGQLELNIVANSRNAKIFENVNQDPPILKKANQSENYLIREVAKKAEAKIKPKCQGTEKPQEIKYNDQRQFIQFFCLPDEIGLNWLVAIIIPEHEVVEEIDSILSDIGKDTVLVLAIATAVFAVITWAYILYKWRLTKAADRFVPEVLIRNKESLNTNIFNAKLGTQVKKNSMTIMFADIRSFTSLSEKMKHPQPIFNFINNYLNEVSPVIRNNGGIVDKYIGDGIMAIFPEPSSAEHAVKAAVEMQNAVEEFNKQNREFNLILQTYFLTLAVQSKLYNLMKCVFPEVVCLQQYPENIRIGVGLHTGELMLGIIGEPERLEVTVISDAVNLASRMEGLTKRYGAGILISRETFELLNNSSSSENSFRCLGQVKVKGRHKAVYVHEVYSGEEKPNLESCFQLYRNRRFTEARQLLERILQINPEDQATKYYKERCEYYQNNEPPEDWSGVEDFN